MKDELYGNSPGAQVIQRAALDAGFSKVRDRGPRRDVVAFHRGDTEVGITYTAQGRVAAFVIDGQPQGRQTREAVVEWFAGSARGAADEAPPAAAPDPAGPPDSAAPRGLDAMVTALDALGRFADAAGADAAGRSEQRLKAEVQRWTRVFAEQLVADHAASVALGERLYKHARALENPTADDFLALGSIARYTAEQANARVAAIAERPADRTTETGEPQS